jgi:DNA-binding GntR family transcriptional regulator
MPAAGIGCEVAMSAKGASPMEKIESGAPATLTSSVYEQLRADLVSGHYKPGERLGADALRQRFETGASPIREALNRLLAEGFVAQEEQKGFRVAPVSEAELRELVMARCWIDGAAIAQAIALAGQQGNTQWEESLVLALHRLSRLKRVPDDGAKRNVEWEKLHRAFHTTLVEGCGSRWMVRISEQLFDAAERYRLLAANDVPERNELDEHRAIVDACLQHRAQDIPALLYQHYERTFDAIFPYLAQVKNDRVSGK